MYGKDSDLFLSNKRFDEKLSSYPYDGKSWTTLSLQYFRPIPKLKEKNAATND